MSKRRIAEEFPLEESVETPEGEPAPEAPPTPAPGRFGALWERLTHIGWAEPALRVGTHVLSLAIVALVVWAMRNYYLDVQQAPAGSRSDAAFAQALPTPSPTSSTVRMPDFTGPEESAIDSISRQGVLHTTIPNRPRAHVITYTVQTGDNLFGIADQYGLKPETILWGNFEILQDNPHLLRPDQVLNILPVDGTYHMWHEGESFTKVAEFYKVDPIQIVEYPGNRLDLATFDVNDPGLEPGRWLIIPGGKRELKDWGPPAISRTNPASARYYGPGHCGAIYEGAVGVGAFIWPTTARYLSGFHYSSVHPAIDIGGNIGNAIFATDAGVVVYAGGSNYGYGNLIVVDHGNGWQSAYAHLSSINVVCGQSVFQGTVIGGLGSTGNSTGPHLHFELVFNGAKVNPLDFLQ